MGQEPLLWWGCQKPEGSRKGKPRLSLAPQPHVWLPHTGRASGEPASREERWCAATWPHTQCREGSVWAERQRLNHTHTTPLRREMHHVVRSLMHILTHSKLICPQIVQTGQRSDRVNQAEFSPSRAHQDLSTCLRGALSEIAVSS